LKNEQEVREQFVSTAMSYFETKQGDARHKEIVDLYNLFSPLPRGYKATYTDAWCAIFVSAIGIKLGWSDIILPECSCGEMIKLYQASSLNKWEERDDYFPKFGDIIMYDWDDGTDYAVSDNKGSPDHVGIVIEINGSNFTVVEGNKSKSVAERKMRVNGRYIRGFCLPAFHTKITASNEPSPWAKYAISWAQQAGLSDCERLKETMTREEAIVLAYRLFNMLK